MFYKRFLLFGFDAYYPIGGFNDLIGSFDTLDEAIEFWNGDTSSDWAGRTPSYVKDWGEIIDLETGEKTLLEGRQYD